MNKMVSLAFIAIGMVLIASGILAMNSVASEYSRMLTGAPTDQSLWLTACGILAAVVGAAGMLHRHRLRN